MNRKELVATLNNVSAALASSDIIPIYKCFAFGGSTVMAYNDIVGIVAPCVTNEQFVVDGKTLLGLLGHSHAESIEIKLEKDEAVIKATRSTFRLPIFQLSDFIFEEPRGEWVTIPINQDFLDGLQACLMTSSRDAAQPALLGVSLSSSGILYSSDSDAISEYKLDDKTAGNEPFMLPNDFCDALLSICNDMNVTEGALNLNSEWSQAVLKNGYTVYGRMIENENPLDFAGQIKQTIKGELDFVEAPKGISNALSRARVLADPESAKTTVTVENGRIKLVTTTSMGIVRDTLAIEDHEDVEANVSAALMQRSLALCDFLAIREDYCAFKSDKLFILTGNME